VKLLRNARYDTGVGSEAYPRCGALIQPRRTHMAAKKAAKKSAKKAKKAKKSKKK
jgi:hypothetical protein